MMKRNSALFQPECCGHDDTEALLRLHYTKEDAMDEASLSEQHNNFQKQISNFQKLLHHAINRFSTEKLNQMLRALSKGLNGANSGRELTISSLKEVKEIVESMRKESEQQNVVLKGDELSLVKYFEAYFQDMDYLQQLKKNFDEKIYICLYNYFYDPADDVEGQYDISDEGEKHREITEELNRLGYSSAIEINKDKALKKIPDKTGVILDKLNDKERLSYAVSELFLLNQNWDRLFEEDIIDPKCFDEDSHHELLQLTGYALYENVLRVVPDMFVKAHKSLELAKLWWTQANKVYEHLPIQRKKATVDEDIKDKEKEIQGVINQLRNEISFEEELLKKLYNELEILEIRERNFAHLNNSCEKMTEEKKAVEKQHNYILANCKHIREKMKSVDKFSKEYQVLDYKLKSHEKDLANIKNDLQGVEYKLSILQGDLDWGMLIRPDMILFTADVIEKIAALEESLRVKTQEKRKHEKKLVLLRTNCERMRQIMRKYIKSVDAYDSNKRQKGMANGTHSRYNNPEEMTEDEDQGRGMDVIFSDVEEEEEGEEGYEIGGPPVGQTTEKETNPTSRQTNEVDQKVLKTGHQKDTNLKAKNGLPIRNKSKEVDPSPQSGFSPEKKYAEPSRLARSREGPKGMVNSHDSMKAQRPSYSKQEPKNSSGQEDHEHTEVVSPKISVSRGSRPDAVWSPGKRTSGGVAKPQAAPRSSGRRISSRMRSTPSMRSALSSGTSLNKSSGAPSGVSRDSFPARATPSTVMSYNDDQAFSGNEKSYSDQSRPQSKSVSAADYYKQFKYHRTNDSILNRKPFPKGNSKKKSSGASSIPVK